MKPNIYLLVLFVVLLGFPQMSETIITPSLPGMAVSLQTSHRLLEFSVSIFFAGFALGVSLWGIAADRWGRLRALRYGLLIFMAGSVACALSQSIEQLYVATFLQALGASSGSVVTQTMLRDIYTDKHERSKAFAIIGMGLAFSPALGPLLGSQLDLFLGWRAIFTFLAALGLILLMWCYGALNETRPEGVATRSMKDVGQLAKVMVKDPFILSCTALVGICNAMVFSFFAEGPYIFVEHLQMGQEEYGWIGIVVSLSIFIAGTINHRYVAAFGPEGLIKAGAMLMTLGSVAYLLASQAVVLSLGTGIAYALALIAPLFVVFLGMGMMISNLLSIALRDYQKVAGSAGSIFGFGYYVVLSLLLAGMSLLHSDSIMPLPAYLVVMSACSFALSTRLKGYLLKTTGS